MQVYAGHVIGGDGGSADGALREATFSYPDVICEDTKGVLYIGERLRNDSLRVVSEDSVTTVSLLNGEDGTALLGSRGWIALGEDDVLHVQLGGRLWFGSTPSEEVSEIRLWKGAEIRLNCFLVRGDGELVGTQRSTQGVVSVRNHVLRTLAVCERTATGIAIDESDHIYVGEKHRILRLTPSGSLEHFAPTNVRKDDWKDEWFSDSTRGMDFDGDGNLYVADASGEVYRVSPQGEVELAVDVGETVNDVLVSRSGHIYIPDYYNHTILRSVDPVTRK